MLLHASEKKSAAQNQKSKTLRRLLSSGARPLCLLALLSIIAALGISSNLKAQGMRVKVFAQTGSACGTGIAHCTTLTWTPSSSAAACVSPCILEYNVFRATTAGGESTTPINASLLAGTTYIDPVTLTANPQTFYYTVEAVETSSGITAIGPASNEVSGSFPGLPAAPTLSGVTH